MLTYMRRLRIVFDASPLLVNKTGVAYYTERLVTSLAEQYSHDVELVGFYYNFLGRRDTSHLPTRPNLRFKAVKFVPGKLIFQLRRWGIEVPVEYLAKTRADFVLYPNFLSYPSLRRTPSAPVIHDLTFIDMPGYVAYKNRQDLVRFVPQAIARSSFVLTVSDFSKQKIHRKYRVPASRIVVTPIPPEPNREFSESQRRKALQNAGITKPYILFLGTVEPRKNLLNLMEAYAQLPDKLRSSYSLVLAGRIGWNCEAEVAKIDELQRAGFDVHHLGYVDEDLRAALYRDATVFVTASSYEGFGMPVLEAMSYGVPTAVSDIAVFHEVAGDAALYFNQFKPAEIAAALETLLKDGRRRELLSHKARKLAASMRWEDIAARVYDAIQRTLNT
jgi:glycosyltransferase involved in cell wall biosynthesis